MKALQIVLVVVCVLVVLLLGGYVYFVYTPEPVKPRLSSVEQHAVIRVGDLDRTYTFYVPDRLKKKPPLLFIFHGSTQNSAGIRKLTGYEFDRLADTAGFIVIYPDGFKQNWNDCRKAASYPARAQNINDKGLVRALIGRFKQDYGIDTARVFATGWSNGGHMSFRLALEMPDEIAGVAIISAGLPTSENMDCTECKTPVSVLIMNGTGDPLNPYEGGQVSFLGLENRGSVLSSLDTARYFTGLAGYGQAPTETVILPHRVPSDPTSVRKDVWRAEGKPEIVLYSVINGGHQIPQPVYRPPRLLGEITADVNAPAEIWSFFERQANQAAHR